MSSPWASVSDHAWADDWHEFLRAAEYEAELRGGDFDVWTALAAALHVWLDHYEGVATMSTVGASPDAPLGSEPTPQDGAGCWDSGRPVHRVSAYILNE
ncbi:MAG: hypothetical protein ACSLFI_00200 [Solirubrobacterales bacterium]